MQRDLLDPQRERRIETPFGFVPFRLLTDGHLHRMSLVEAALYLFFSLVADRRGMSFCSDRHLRDVLKLDDDEIHQARRGLKQKGLLAFKRERQVVTYQLLSLPSPTAAPAIMRTRRVLGADAATTTAKTPPPVDQRQPREVPHFDVTQVRQVIALLSGKMSPPEANNKTREVP